MRKTYHQPRAAFTSALRATSRLIMLAAALTLGLEAQATTNVTDNFTPSGVAPGSPAGSYVLSDFDTINPYNGNLNFRLPLLRIGGRGTASYTMMLKVDLRWTVNHDFDAYGAPINTPTIDWWVWPDVGYGPGLLQGRQQVGEQCSLNDPYITQVDTLTRLTFTAPDGTEYELRDQLWGGQRKISQCYTNGQQNYYGVSRGRVFATADGTSMTFVSDEEIKDVVVDYGGGFPPTGTLYMRDGTRYRIQSGSVTSITDRNGNRIAFTYDTSSRVKTIVDPAGHQVTVDYEVQDSAPYGLCDQIKFNGFNGAQRIIRISKGNLSGALRPDFTLRTPAQLFPNFVYASNSAYLDPVVTSAVWLPDGARKYQLYYNSYSELAKVVLPTGGVFEYDWAGGDVSAAEIFRYVTERRVYTSPSVLEGKTVYTNTGDPSSPNDPRTIADESVYGPNNALIAKTKHYYYGSPTASLFPPYQFHYSGWREGKEFKTEQFAADGTTVLKRLELTWEQRAPVTWWWGTANDAPSNDPRVTEAKTTLVDTGQVTKQTFAYDQYNNPTDKYEYDYGAGAAGALLRRTHTDFVTNYAYVNVDANPALGPSLRSLPQQVWISTDVGGSNKAALTVFNYDQYGLSDCPGIVGHDGAYTTGFTVRGNITGVTRYADAAGGGGAVTSALHYDIAGNVVSSTDARGNTSYVSYSDNFSDGNNWRYTYAFPTSTTSAVPDPTGQFGSTSALVSVSAYDYSTGLVTAATDPNNRTTTYDYTDPFDRLKVVTRPDNGTTSYTYDRAANVGLMSDYLRTVTSLDSSRSVESYQFYDGLGRPSRTFLHEGGSPAVFLTTDTQYDAAGRVWRVSNPYRTNGSGDGINPAGRWTTTGYDALGRVTSVITPDGAALTTSYEGNTTTVTDQASKRRRRVTDGLGRAVRIDEPDGAGNLGSPSSPVQPNVYTYDALGNLRKVDQGGQLRFFMFDSLSRLVRDWNPEQATNGSLAVTDSVTGNVQWSNSYGYDANGNLTSRTDARGVTATFGYDSLNRNTTARYSDGTKDIDRHYDGAINGKGRFYYFNWDPNNNTRFDTHLAIDEYDVMGRVVKYRQHFLTNGAASPQFTVTRSYDKAGNIISQTYPSGHTVTYTYDVAGRQSEVAGNLGDGVQRVYAADVTYDEFGGIRQERFGTQTPLYHKLHYNKRGQLFDIRLSTQSLAANEWDWNRGALVNYYSGNYAWEGDPNTPAAADNNGNLRLQQHWYPGDDSYNGYTYTQDSFEYDALNRLAWIKELHGGAWGQSGQDFAQTYAYDRWGNRTIDAGQTSAAYNKAFDLNPPSNTWEVPEPSNRLYAAGDNGRLPGDKLMRYDAAGNLVYDAYSTSGAARVYDANNRMTAAVGHDGNWDYYTYDADGRRIKRKIANEEWWQVYGPDGEMLAEYPAGAAPFLAAKEYGYRGGELLVTISSGDVERLKRFVKNLYYNCLARDPSPSELSAQMDQLAQAGAQGGETQLLTTARSIARGLFESTEYINRGRTVEQYVTDLYNAYLQRGPDANGLSNWVNNTNLYGRGATLNAFEVCTEFSTLSATVYGTAAGGDDQRVDTFVRNFYYGAFQREPTATEAQQQRQRLNNAAAISRDQVIAEARAMGVELIQSTNYNASHTTEQYVTDLYQAFLQRAPDGIGLGFWVNNTNQNGRAATLDAFRLATEYSELAGTLYRETFWLVPDHLGTPRMVVYKTGSLAGVKRHDYLPFGEELAATAGGRSTGQGYGGNDNVRQKLVTNERDAETDLDYFSARYYSSVQGRFTSVDPAGYSASTPQGFNRYQNCLNNPLRYVDPDGLYNKDVHYSLTRLLALAAGFTDPVAEAIASKDQELDKHKTKNPYGYYGRKQNHFTSPERRKKLVEKFVASGSVDDLAIYLHAMQDSYSHAGFPAWSGQVDITQPYSQWDDADDTWRDVPKADDMAQETYNFLVGIAAPVMQQKGTATQGPLVPWVVIAPLVHQFNAASTEGEKNYMLVVLEVRIRTYLIEQQLKKLREEERKRKRKRGAHEL